MSRTFALPIGDQLIRYDHADDGLVRQCKWHIDSVGYVAGTIGGKRYRLHRAIMGARKGEVVDHINRDPLDNRRCNLRITNRAGNAQNAGPHRHNKSGFKGVYLCSSTGRWRAEIRVNGKGIKLGRHDSRITAALAYDAAAIKHHGQFALTNAALGLLTSGPGCGA